MKPGCLFVALSGTPSGGFISSFASARDGWEFADKAEAAGAVAMIVPHRIEGVQRSAADRQGYADRRSLGLGARGAGAVQGPGDRPHRQRRQDQHQGILAAYPAAYASPSSFNNFWGVPLTLCNASPARACGWWKWA